MKNLKERCSRLWLASALWLTAMLCFGQTATNTTAESEQMSELDSLKAARDSIEHDLRQQVQELKLQSIMMQERLERTGKSIREDSLRLAARKARIDSLRSVTSGAPLVVEGDTLLVIYARKGGTLPEARVESAHDKIVELGKSLSMFTDSIYTFDSEVSTDIMAGEEVLLSVTDLDAMWNNATRQQLATQYRDIISQEVELLHDKYGLRQKVISIIWSLLVVAALIAAIIGIVKLFRRWRFRLAHKLLSTIKPISVKDYVLLGTHHLGIVMHVAFNLIRIALILFLVLVSVPLIFSAFPETKAFTFSILGYVWNPLKDIFQGIWSYLPSLFKIAVIVICFHYLLRVIHYFANEIANERLNINGFYADWAMPTYTILRVLLYSFMFVMIWPLLPNSNSEVFQGVSVFIGIIVSLGSTSVVGNVMAGLVMTYMRPFHVGDYIRFGDTEGEVVEKTMLVTRIRTRKNEVVTVPNSNMMSSQTSNFSFSAQQYGIVVHTKVTIGYDEPWQKIESLLLKAANETEGIRKHPAPFVNVTALDDFYVEYEINGYTERTKTLPRVYTALHQHMLDIMHDAGVEIMSPHINALRNDLPPQIPPRNKA